MCDKGCDVTHEPNLSTIYHECLRQLIRPCPRPALLSLNNLHQHARVSRVPRWRCPPGGRIPAVSLRPPQPRDHCTPSTPTTVAAFLTNLSWFQSRAIYSQTISVLYRTVELDGTAQSCITLDMLYEHHDIARHVQKLVVRQGGSPDPSQSTGSPTVQAYADPSYVCTAVKRVATRLDALRCFIWGGEDYPWDDDIWLVLRRSCVHSFLTW